MGRFAGFVWRQQRSRWPRGRFILQLGSGQTLLISHNIDLAPRLTALREGDVVAFNGEYEWSATGGVVHWTHRDPEWPAHGGVAEAQRSNVPGPVDRSVVPAGR